MMIQAKQPINRNFSFVLDELFNTLPTTISKENNLQRTGIPANVEETEEGYHLSLMAPGRKKEDFKVNIDKDQLTISYEKKNEEKDVNVKSIRKEFLFGSFSRTFHLDEKVNADAIEAKYDNGVLKFFLPKKEEVKVLPKAITIQ